MRLAYYCCYHISCVVNIGGHGPNYVVKKG